MPLILSLCLIILLATTAFSAPAVSNLQAEYRDGQVFLTWDEPPGLQGPLAVRMSDQPITAASLAQATLVAPGLNPGSALDWWLNPETYGAPLEADKTTGQKPAIPHEGFMLRPHGQRLNPDSGLHVHTVGKGEDGPRYYAVTTSDNLEVAAGTNSLDQPVTQQVAPVQPIWDSPAPILDPAKGRGLPLHLQLHAKRGRQETQYVAFGDASLGWREGLPFKFGVSIGDGVVMIRPIDRIWIGRMFPEGTDECQRLTPALHTFWYGYNSNINDRARMAEGVVTNYTERRLLWIIDWVQRTFGTDPNRVYAAGSSMGGCGMMSFAFRHPEIFAAIYAHVPIVAYDRGPGGDSTVRVVRETGGMDVMTNEGMTVKDRLDATKFAREHKGDLPLLIIVNGRQDSSIPWWKNPDFYRAMRDQRQGFIAAWNDGDHGGTGGKLPDDLKQLTSQRTWPDLALNKSYLAFSNSSQDGDPGNGEADSGDIVGYMNRGLWWEEPVDEAQNYSVVVKWTLEADKLPVTVDLTPRRLQAFKLKPGDQLVARNLAADGTELQKQTLQVDDQGLATFKGFQVTTAAGNKLVLTK